MVTLVVILVLLAIALSIGIYLAGKAKNKQQGIVPAKKTGDPGFIIRSQQDSGFKIISVSGKPQPPPMLGDGQFKGIWQKVPPAGIADNFNLHEVTQNLTAICKLTGRKAADCNCDRHRTKKQTP